MTSESPDADQRRWGMICHASGLLVFATGGIGGVLGPLIVWLAKRHSGTFIDDQGRQAINFQITVLLLVIAGAVLLVMSYGFGLIVLGFVYAWDLVMIVVAASRAWDGQRYRYPWSLVVLRSDP